MRILEIGSVRKSNHHPQTRRVRTPVPLLRERGGRSGFTLVEILVVIVVIVLLAGMMIPVFDSGLGRARTKGALNRAQSMMNLASSMAASEGQTIRFNVETEEGRFWLSIEEAPLENPGQFVPLKMSDLSSYRLDEEISITAWRVDGVDPEEERDPYIEFYPEGTAEKAAIVFESAGGEEFTILVSKLTSRVRVRDVNVLAQEEEEF